MMTRLTKKGVEVKQLQTTNVVEVVKNETKYMMLNLHQYPPPVMFKFEYLDTKDLMVYVSNKKSKPSAKDHDQIYKNPE